ncbi:MAG: OmpA family protein [Vibrio sp.]
MSSSVVIKRGRKDNKSHLQAGGWKVAMADLMIALMCLFLVLWIIQILDNKDKEKLVHYFSEGEMEMQNDFSGDGTGNSISPLTLPNVATSRDESELPKTEDLSLIEGEYNTQKELQTLAGALQQRIDSLGGSDSVNVRVTPQGLKLIIADSKQGPMFYRSSSRITPFYQDLLVNLAPAFKSLSNSIIITGHTDSSKFVGSKRVTNWELSAERANVARYYLQAGGMPAERIFQVSGMADTAPMENTHAGDADNRRVELFILTRKVKNVLRGVYKKGAVETAEQVNAADDQASLQQLKEKKQSASRRAAFNQPVTEFEVVKRIK